MIFLGGCSYMPSLPIELDSTNTISKGACPYHKKEKACPQQADLSFYPKAPQILSDSE